MLNLVANLDRQQQQDGNKKFMFSQKFQAEEKMLRA
jgi:hypothetical protein